MLAFKLPPDRRFQMRAVAIIRLNGHVLLHRAPHETFWSLPGGRVEFGETAAETLVREIAEELGCTSSVSALRYLVENFFVYNATACHEIGWYYEAELTSAFPFVVDDICHRASEGAFDLEFRWVPCQADSFKTYPLLPRMLETQLLDPSPGFRHIVEGHA